MEIVDDINQFRTKKSTESNAPTKKNLSISIDNDAATFTGESIAERRKKKEKKRNETKSAVDRRSKDLLNRIELRLWFRYSISLDCFVCYCVVRALRKKKKRKCYKNKIKKSSKRQRDEWCQTVTYGRTLNTTNTLRWWWFFWFSRTVSLFCFVLYLSRFLSSAAGCCALPVDEPVKGRFWPEIDRSRRWKWWAR